MINHKDIFPYDKAQGKIILIWMMTIPPVSLIAHAGHNLGHVVRKTDFIVCEQRRRPAYASTQSDQSLCYSLSGEYGSQTGSMQNLNILTTCSVAEQTSLSHTLPETPTPKTGFLTSGAYLSAVTWYYDCQTIFIQLILSDTIGHEHFFVLNKV